MKKVIVIFFMLSSLIVKAQKIDSIYFNLYTDSLKKDSYNYINVDGKYSNGTFLPLMSDEVIFSSTGGNWDGNNLIISKDFNKDSVMITARLKDRPDIKRSVSIYIKKMQVDPPLKTEKELLEEWNKDSIKKRKG